MCEVLLSEALHIAVFACRLTAQCIAALVCVMLGAACAKAAAKPKCKATYVIPMTWVSSVDGLYNAAINIVRYSASLLSALSWHLCTPCMQNAMSHHHQRYW